VPQWYCSDYSNYDNYANESCGKRTCYDINACGLNINKPLEYAPCNANGDSESKSQELPQGYFTLNTDIIHLVVDQDTVSQKVILINGTEADDYTLQIEYPSAYTKGTEFVSTSMNSKHIEYSGDFNIVVDARNILVGTYVIPITIQNTFYKRNISAIIDIKIPKDGTLDIKLDSNIKTIGADKNILIETIPIGAKLNEGDAITYFIIDAKGIILDINEQEIIDPKKIMEVIDTPTNAGEGYYTIAVKIVGNNKEYSKSTTFTLLEPKKYSQIIIIPTDSNKTNMWLWTLIIIIFIILLVNAAIIYYNYNILSKKYDQLSNMPGFRKKVLFKQALGKYKVLASIGIREKVKTFWNKVGKEETPTEDKQLELLKKSYEKGFISLPEYRDALRRMGYSVEASGVNQYYEDLKNKERVEGSKHNISESNNVKLKESPQELPKEETVIKENIKPSKEIISEPIKEKVEETKIESANIEPSKPEEVVKDTVEEAEAEKEVIELEKELKKDSQKPIVTETIEIQTSEPKSQTITGIETKETLQNPIEENKPIKSKEDNTELNNTETIIKTVIPKEDILNKNSENRFFVLNNGETIHTLGELLNALSYMPDYVFDHHTKYGRNDFANWCGDVFRYYDVAEEIRKAESKNELIGLLRKYSS
jgi:hypothetical protein